MLKTDGNILNRHCMEMGMKATGQGKLKHALPVFPLKWETRAEWRSGGGGEKRRDESRRGRHECPRHVLLKF